MTNKIKTWLVRGDTHGDTDWILYQLEDCFTRDTAVIVLGDLGWNFYLNETDQKKKEYVNSLGYPIYAVRGNHEMRPQHLENIKIKYDKEIHGPIYYEPEYPCIHYFMDYGIYTINNYRCLVIGGAYSVDKWWRLESAGIHDPSANNPKKTGWFADECLTETEMWDCEDMIESSGNNVFDFVFSHTCPKKFQPTDLFLRTIDQSKVDDSMEVWMDEIYSKIVVNSAWIFGHYHADRIEAPHVEQYFNYIEDLDTIAARWQRYDKTGELDWWLTKGGNFYMNKEK